MRAVLVLEHPESGAALDSREIDVEAETLHEATVKVEQQMSDGWRMRSIRQFAP